MTIDCGAREWTGAQGTELRSSRAMILDMCRGLARARPYVKQCHRLQGKNLNRVVTMLLEEKCTFREKRDIHYLNKALYFKLRREALSFALKCFHPLPSY